jgi:serine/threonine-protein kinase RsbW
MCPLRDGSPVGGSLQSVHIAARAELESLPEVLATIASAIRQVAGRDEWSGEIDVTSLNLSEQFDADVISACTELFTNVVRHGYGGGSPDLVEIEVEPSNDRVVIRMTDNGKPFDPAAVEDPELSELPEHGMGIFIVRRCMDRAVYEPGPPNRWTLERRYQTRPRDSVD